MKNTKLKTTEFEERIDSLFRHANYWHWSQQELLSEYKRIVLDELDSKAPSGKARYPVAVRSYASGYYMAKDKQHLNNMEFCYDVDGTLYTTAKASNRPHWRQIGTAAIKNVPNGYYYKDKDVKYS